MKMLINCQVSLKGSELKLQETSFILQKGEITVNRFKLFLLNIASFGIGFMIITRLNLFEFPTYLKSLEIGLFTLALSIPIPAIIGLFQPMIGSALKNMTINLLCFCYNKTGMKFVPWVYASILLIIFFAFSLICWYCLIFVSEIIFKMPLDDMKPLYINGRSQHLLFFPIKAIITTWLFSLLPFIINFLNVRFQWSEDFKVLKGTLKRVCKITSGTDVYFETFLNRNIDGKQKFYFYDY